MLLWMVLSTLLLASACLVGVYRKLALAQGWVDTPNHRSSHSRATPRGAGLVFALLIGLASVAGVAMEVMPPTLAGGVVTGLGIAWVGWWDDLKGVAARYRFGLYWLVSLAASLFIYEAFARAPRDWALLAILFATTAALQWLVNLYNFMDGINGIAAAEAIFVLCAMFVCGVHTGGASWLLACAVVAIAGFLFWNFPVALVFMGDAGSAFLGFLLGLMMIWSGLQNPASVAIGLILLGVFIVDATYTLLVRMFTGQAWYQGHRQHAYQIWARRCGSHSRVVAGVLMINLFWLLPWAWLVAQHRIAAPWALALAYAPLLVICCASGAGKASPTQV